MLGTSKNIWGFDPRSVPGCQLWLDAADSNTVTGTTSVTAWRDKSGNGYVANSFVNSVPNPSWVSNVQNGNGVIQYSAGNGSSIANFVLAQTMSIFKVYYPINQSTGSPFIEHGPNLNNESGFYFHAQGGQNFAIRNESGQVPVNPVNFGNTTISNTWQMIQGINPDPSNSNAMTFYLNGTVKASSATTGSGTTIITKTLYINGRGGANNLSYNTYLAELIIYNIGVTTSQRQQIEGYLANKWGLTTPIPLTHPFKSIRPHLRTFQPTDIPGCQLWLDGADQSSLVLSGSNVTQWNDKSGNGRNVSATGSPVITTDNNGLKHISFNGSSYFTTNFTALSGVSYVSWIAVANVTNAASANYGTIVGTSYASNNYAQNQLYVNQGNLMIFFRRVSGGTSYNTTVALSSGRNILQSITNYTNGNYQLYQNGVASTLQTNGPTSAIASETVNLTIGYDLYPGETILTGTISEILLYTQPLTTDQRQQIEGYLAHKWGLTTPIPSTHPFKSFPPATSAHFSPTSITGCQLWLDAADPAGTGVLPSNGASLTIWVDKSGNTYNVSQNASLAVPVFRQSLATNGLPGLDFTGGGGLLSATSFAKSLNVTLLLVGMVRSTIGAWGTFWGHFPNGDHDFNAIQLRNTSGQTVINWHTNNNNSTSQLSYTLNSMVLYSCTMTNGNIMFIQQTNTSGTNSVTITNGAVTINTNTAPIWVGRSDSSEAINSYIYEIVYFQRVLSLAERQQVEGYLAHKWGLTNSLPSKHPYKPSPPIFPPNLFFPTPSMYSALFNSGSLSVPANAALTLGTNNHTFEFWMYQTSRNFYDVPFIYGNTAGNATNNYYMNHGQYIAVVIGNGAGGFSLIMGGGVSLPALNTWSHYAVVRNGTTFTLYINGTNVASATASISIPAQGGVMAIGGLNSGGNTISGYMTNFRFVNGTAVYTSNFTPPTTPLTAIPNTQVLIQGLVDRGPNAFTVTSTGGVTLSTSVTPF